MIDDATIDQLTDRAIEGYQALPIRRGAVLLVYSKVTQSWEIRAGVLTEITSTRRSEEMAQIQVESDSSRDQVRAMVVEKARWIEGEVARHPGL